MLLDVKRYKLKYDPIEENLKVYDVKAVFKNEKPTVILALSKKFLITKVLKKYLTGEEIES